MTDTPPVSKKQAEAAPAQPEKSELPNLFELGRRSFQAFISEFESYGIETDPRMELRQGQGLLCYYDFKDGNVYLAVPDLSNPASKLHLLMLRSILRCPSNAELLKFFELFIPYVIAHELAHHYRHRYGLFHSDNLWDEEQIANQLAVAVTKHRLSPADKEAARKFLANALEGLSSKLEAKNLAADSYYNFLYALNASGQIGAADVDNVEWLQELLDVNVEDILIGSGQLSGDAVQRLERRDEVIEAINEQYASDYTRYIYYHVGWLYLALTNNETQYVEEFSRTHLKLQADLLPRPEMMTQPDDCLLQACFKAHRDTQDRSSVASRYFYKRYRSLLLARLQAIELHIPSHTQQLRRQAGLLLESWNEHEADTLNYLAQLAPPQLRNLFPHLIDDHLDPNLDVEACLPAETDRRLWRHVMRGEIDEGTANTLYRLTLLDQIDIYRPLPAEVQIELAHNLCRVRLSAGETIIWEGEVNDDVYILHSGRLAVFIIDQGAELQVGAIEPGQLFGEAAFLTQEPRTATVRAQEPSECFVLKDSDLHLFAFQHPEVLMQMAGALARRIAALNRANVGKGAN